MVTVVGLPKGEHADVTVRGPKHFKKTFSKVGRTTLKGLTAGNYQLRVHAVKLRANHGRARRGARVAPVLPTVQITVASGDVATTTAAYGTITNPNVRTVKSAIKQIIGPPNAPTAIVVGGRSKLAKGDLISQPTSPGLPYGLMSRVTATQRTKGDTTISLQPASAFEAVPNADFDIPVQLTSSAKRAGTECSVVLTDGMLPWVSITNARIQGRWNTVKTFGVDIAIGIKLTTTFHAHITNSIERSLGASCSVSAHALYLQAVTPVPVYGTIDPKIGVEIKSGVKYSLTGDVDVTAGGSTIGAPPGPVVWYPVLSFANPSFSATAERIAELTVGFGLNAALGVGQPDTVNAHVEEANSLNFKARPGSCDINLDLGTFNAGGKIGPLTLKTPDTPPLSHHQLWSGCAGVGSGPPEPPATVPATGPSVIYQGDTVGRDADGDLEFSEFEAATGERADVVDTMPADLVPYRCVVLDINDSFTDALTEQIRRYLAAGGTVLAIGEHEGYGWSTANDAMNELATALGATGVSLNDDRWDNGPNYTNAISESPLTAGVTWIGDNLVSSVAVEPPAVALVGTSEDESVPFIASQNLGSGTFVLAGDSNAFSDNNGGGFADNDNGIFVHNLCP